MAQLLPRLPNAPAGSATACDAYGVRFDRAPSAARSAARRLNAKVKLRAIRRTQPLFPYLMVAQKIYCDKSGFTGPELLRGSPYFTYSSVAIEPDEAGELVARIIRDYRIQAAELKGRKMLRHPRGRRAVDDIFKKLVGRTKTGVFEKRFALAGKFYEYVFEPPLAKQSGIFYAARFHLFIANLLYLHLIVQRHSDNVLEDFQEAMRNLSEGRPLFSSRGGEDESLPMQYIAAFYRGNTAAIQEELGSLGSETDKWILDLTSTALHSLLCEWAETADLLDVTCDESKPLAASNSIWDAMVGNDRRAYHLLFGTRQRITYNLLRPVELARSIDTPGLQIADVIASATAAVFERPNDPTLQAFRERAIEGCSSNLTVLPMLAEIDLESLAVQRNYIVLRELAERSARGEQLLPECAWLVLELTAAAQLSFPERLFEVVE